MSSLDSLQAQRPWPNWIMMFGVSFVSFFAFVFVVWLLSSQLEIHPGELGGPMFLLWAIGLGLLSPRGYWGSIFGSTIAFVIFNGVLNSPEYGAAGHIAYSVGFFLVVTLIILCAAGLRRLLSSSSTKSLDDHGVR